jgi:hypothetical protein
MVIRKSSKPPARRPSVKRGTKHVHGTESIIVRLARIGESVPAEDWDKLPRDSAKNFDHYAHGSPREE